ncbi:YdcH family protein [Hansschlegelia plantiphila]|uniref:DUF465 domain-containing protein n=1 Tax=Hansschlegelia plantiphila TaxID=374655 RepID=A0A9W6MV04_9HYPH|nr:DUF465 domain-containing protein [Hansschlegelia plantiphila]GLK67361.1 DUF465 domain-containing protein [Hansschlegelia plantiphila]
MSMESHIAELEKKHRAIEREIEVELTHPSTDEVKVSSLKRKKLRIKDEMTRLQPLAPTIH